jgi:hypothetical protein
VSIIKYVDAAIITIKYVTSNTIDVLDISFVGMTNILTFTSSLAFSFFHQAKAKLCI